MFRKKNFTKKIFFRKIKLPKKMFRKKKFRKKNFPKKKLPEIKFLEKKISFGYVFCNFAKFDEINILQKLSLKFEMLFINPFFNNTHLNISFLFTFLFKI